MVLFIRTAHHKPTNKDEDRYIGWRGYVGLYIKWRSYGIHLFGVSVYLFKLALS